VWASLVPHRGVKVKENPAGRGPHGRSCPRRPVGIGDAVRRGALLRHTGRSAGRADVRLRRVAVDPQHTGHRRDWLGHPDSLRPRHADLHRQPRQLHPALGGTGAGALSQKDAEAGSVGLREARDTRPRGFPPGSKIRLPLPAGCTLAPPGSWPQPGTLTGLTPRNLMPRLWKGGSCDSQSELPVALPELPPVDNFNS